MDTSHHLFPSIDWIKEEAVPPAPTIEELVGVCFRNPNTSLFVTVMIEKEIVAAISYITTRVSFNTEDAEQMVVSKVYLSEIVLFLNIAQLVIGIGSTHRSLLAETYRGFLQHTSGPMTSTLPFPTTIEEFRSTVMNTYNKNSLMSILPYPQIHSLSDRHALVDVQEFLAISLAFENRFAIPEKYVRVNASPAIRKKFSESPAVNSKDCLYASISLWFDDWDHSTGLTKANKNSIWSGVACVVFSNSTGKVVSVHTDVIAVGPAKVDHLKTDHHQVLPFLVNSVKALQDEWTTRKYYCRKRDSWYNVFPDITYYTCDQPAKRALAGLMAGNSTYHACFGYSFNTQQLDKPIVACSGCFTRLKNGTSVPRNCSWCYCWNLPGVNPLMKYKDGSKPFVLDVDLLKDVWKSSWEDLLNGVSSKTVEESMGRHCINVAEAKRLVDAHRNSAAIPPHPPMWDISELHEFLEAPMHLMAGVVKAVTKLNHQWALKINQETRLVQSLQGMITLLQKYCRVNSYRLVSYPNKEGNKDNIKFPGWIADVFRSWVKMMPWFYSVIDDESFVWTPYEPEHYEYEKWTNEDRKKYLSTRGFSGCSQLNKTDLNKKLDEIHAKGLLENYPPPGAHVVTGKDVQELVWYTYEMFKYLFASEAMKQEEWNTEYAIKKFLTKLAYVDSKVNMGSAKPLYVSKYNMLSLLRLPDHLKKFTSLRYLQEGGQEGEGIVKPLRDLTANQLQDNFAKHLLSNKYREGFIDLFLDEVKSEGVSDAPDDIYPHFRRYNSKEEILELFFRQLPISVVFVSVENTIRFGVVLFTNGQLWLYPVTSGKSISNQEFAFEVFEFSLVGSTKPLLLRGREKDIKLEIVTFGYLLPKYPVKEERTSFLGSLVTVEMQSLGSDGKLH